MLWDLKALKHLILWLQVFFLFVVLMHIFLYDIRSIHSFVSPHFALKLGVGRTLVEFGLVVTTSLKEVFMAQFEYKPCVVWIRDKDTQATLILLGMLDFDVILGMDWLSLNYATVDYHHKLVRFDYLRKPSISI